MPDHPDGQKGESKISDYRKRAVCVGDVDNGINRNAKASASGVDDPGPKKRNRFALKHGDEEESDAAQDSEAPGDVDDDPVGAVGGETQQETGDAGLDEYHASTVCDVGKVPPLLSVNNQPSGI